MIKPSNILLRTSFVITLLTLALSGCGSKPGEPTCGTCTGTPIATAVYTMQFTGTYPNTNPTILNFSATQSDTVTLAGTQSIPVGFSPFAMATDKIGGLHVVGALNANTANPTPEVVATTPGNTNIAPSILAGSLTQLAGAESIAIDNTGQIYVLTTTGTVNIYAANATGNVAPIRSFNITSMVTGTGIAVDSSGNVYVGAFIDSTIQVYDPTAIGNATPIHIINGSSTQLGHVFQLAIDSSNQLYVGTSNTAGQGILIFASGASGNIAPTRVIQGSSTGFNALTGIAIDNSNRIYEADAANFGNLTGPSLNIFPANATGNMAPSTHITSSSWTATSEGSTLAVF